MVGVHLHDIDDLSEQRHVDWRSGGDCRLGRRNGGNGSRQRALPSFQCLPLCAKSVGKRSPGSTPDRRDVLQWDTDELQGDDLLQRLEIARRVDAISRGAAPCRCDIPWRCALVSEAPGGRSFGARAALDRRVPQRRRCGISVRGLVPSGPSAMIVNPDATSGSRGPPKLVIRRPRVRPPSGPT